METTPVHSLAESFQRFPGAFAFQVRAPEGEGTALLRSYFIYAAPVRVQYAIAVGTFKEAYPMAHLAQVFLGKFTRGFLHVPGYGIGLFSVNPDVTGFPAAAVAASLTLKVQTGTVPRLFMLHAASLHLFHPGRIGA